MMPYHRFKVGQTVYAPPGGLDALIPHGPFVIVRLLPLVDGEPHYRVRGTVDGREWAVLERQIRLVEKRPALPEPPPPRPSRTRGKSARRA
jgi:hypothetical protein